MKGAAEMSPAASAAAAAVVERAEEGGDKERKKNKRRSSRRSKQNSPNPAVVIAATSSSTSEARGVSSLSSGNAYKTKYYTSNMNSSALRQPEFDANPLSEPEATTASDVAFTSMPSMHINEKVEPLSPAQVDRSSFSKSCPEPIASRSPFGTGGDNDVISFYGQSKVRIFAPYWSMEDVNKALEMGEAFKAIFRVNAHNRAEAYCKIEGVSTDVLISGVAAQNRAVEGDTVVIKVDPLACWNKMKGSSGSSNSISSAEDCNLLKEASGQASGSCKGKCKVDADIDLADSGSSLIPTKGSHCCDGSFVGEPVLYELNGKVDDNSIPQYHCPSDASLVGSPSRPNEVISGVARLCAMVSSYPSKRPTAKVVAIIEKSTRRGAVVGFLNFKQFLYYRKGCKKDAKENRSPVSLCDNEYIQLTPTDPRLPKMMVPLRGMPDLLKRRLEDGDASLEMELVAAQIDDWGEESPFPLAQVSHVFGRGSEMDSQINAILYENAIYCSEFSAESLTCLPHNTWKVPQEEIHRRRDLRNVCMFTVDPSTATDLDDALSVERLPGGTVRVGVHITDVSFFVLPDTALDLEAQNRSTSVYVLQKKLPMLPPLLSENLGSLIPGVDRLAFSIMWDLNSAGDVIDRWIGRTVIQSCCKLSYELAQCILDGMINERDLPQLHGHFEWVDVTSSLKNLHKVSKILREKRFDSGALRLENSKIHFLLDECGIPYDCVLSEPKESDFLVEEFMLLANSTAAEVISRAFPASALLRRHPEPNLRKLKEFEAFCSKHGLALDTSSSGCFHRSLESIREKLKDDSVLFDILISYATRPMQLASYFCSGDLKENMNDWGHYALAVPLYTHFTSPLRRYPDIVVHRTLAAAIEAEELLMNHRRELKDMRQVGNIKRCFTGIYFDKDVAESLEGREALSAAALKHRVPATEVVAAAAAHCNDRTLASRHVKDGCEKLYMWALLKKKEVLFSEARVLGLGPRFMSVYIKKLAIERRIYYDEVEGLIVEWLEATSTLVLNHHAPKRTSKKGGPGCYRPLDDVALVINPYDLNEDHGMAGEVAVSNGKSGLHSFSKTEIDPAVFPLTVRLLSTISVALHAVGGDDGPLDIGVRLFMSSYFS